ncbi:hypothetical protein B7494_g4961 [Chlorociboria aeruginascens]|nr:hypothetical protein B7494_g4961 [Chlorociboria aeruginascens]
MGNNENTPSMDSNASIESLSPRATEPNPNPKKRAVLVDAAGNPKPVKRRAAKACAACRARKVRCDVMQRYHITADGEVTCSNCTMDGIRKQYNVQLPSPASIASQQPAMDATHAWRNGLVNPTDTMNADGRRSSESSSGEDYGSHVPHPIYQTVNQQLHNGQIARKHLPHEFGSDPAYALLTSASIHGDTKRTHLVSSIQPPLPHLKHKLPDYVKPLPPRMTSVDIDYLYAKGALCLPEVHVRNALLRSFIEYVHPYMPLVELHELLHIIDEGTGESGKISLLLFQAIMFTGTAFVDLEFLKAAGYSSRKAARRAFFQKARVLYDFDYETDRVSLVQSLLLMTYWYETPDDQKDTWHWMGVAISLGHTIGLHRNPENSDMDGARKKLWKRIWWSCFMRDRLVALGMRRPTRIKEEDYNVPMLTEDDFEIKSLPDTNMVISKDCGLIRDVEAQRSSARMTIANAKLSLCISHVLSAQYSVLVKYQGMQCKDGSAASSIMLLPKKLDQTDEVRRCDLELQEWVDGLPSCCVYFPEVLPGNSGSPIFVQRALLHMVYQTTVSALHRPQVLPDASQRDKCIELHELSRRKVCDASREITRYSQDLHSFGLDRYLPTTGVTVLLPAIIIHLLDIKSCNDEARQAAVDGFQKCMIVLEKLRETYASADYATKFLEAAIAKAQLDIQLPKAQNTPGAPNGFLSTDKLNARRVRPRRPSTTEFNPQTTFLDGDALSLEVPMNPPSNYNLISMLTPPEDKDHQFADDSVGIAQDPSIGVLDTQLDLEDFVNFDENSDMWNVQLGESAHGESGGFLGDMSWIDHAPTWSRMNSPAPENGLGASVLLGTQNNEVGVMA